MLWCSTSCLIVYPCLSLLLAERFFPFTTITFHGEPMVTLEDPPGSPGPRHCCPCRVLGSCLSAVTEHRLRWLRCLRLSRIFQNISECLRLISAIQSPSLGILVKALISHPSGSSGSCSSCSSFRLETLPTIDGKPNGSVNWDTSETSGCRYIL